jgi:hypothetical protein
MLGRGNRLWPNALLQANANASPFCLCLTPSLTVIERKRTNRPRTRAARSVPARRISNACAWSDNFRRRKRLGVRWCCTAFHLQANRRGRAAHIPTVLPRSFKHLRFLCYLLLKLSFNPANRRTEGNDVSFCNPTARSTEQKRRSTGALQNAGASSDHFCNREASWTTMPPDELHACFLLSDLMLSVHSPLTLNRPLFKGRD